jgi:hypothetical protein
MKNTHMAPVRIAHWMQACLALAAATLPLSVAGPTAAEVTLAYSMEDGLQGFVANGSDTEITLDTIGATEGVNSMKVDLGVGAFFSGPLTGELAPQIGDPPGLDGIVFDLTITEAFPDEGFIDAGIIFFAATQPDGGQEFGLDVQFFFDQVSLGALTVGTHEIEFRLTKAFHPKTFAEGSFNDLFGEAGSGPNDLIPIGFEIYFNKSTNAPWTGYIDNIRIGTLPPPFDADFNDDTFVDGIDLALWKTAFGQGPQADADGDGDSDGDDFLAWQRQFSPPSGGVAAIPEPGTAGLLAAAFVAVGWAGRSALNQTAARRA